MHSKRLTHSSNGRRQLHNQTPQVFERELLLEVYKKSASSGKMFTDDAALVEAFSPVRAKLVKGHAHNMKITYAEDLTTARLLWKDNLQ